MTINTDLLNRVIKRIGRDLENWDQEAWAIAYDTEAFEKLPKANILYSQYLVMDDLAAPMCGTTMCLAGHTVLEAGDKILFHANSNDLSADYCQDTNGNVHMIRDRAGQLLGMDESEGHYKIFGSDAGDGDFDKFKELIEDTLEIQLDD